RGARGRYVCGTDALEQEHQQDERAEGHHPEADAYPLRVTLALPDALAVGPGNGSVLGSGNAVLDELGSGAAGEKGFRVALFESSGANFGLDLLDSGLGHPALVTTADFG